MPYFVYKILPGKKLEPLDVFDTYRDAKVYAREQRAAAPEDADYSVKMVFAAMKAQAEVLLTTEREPRPLGEDA
ncbi:MAG: hypothetical protein ACPG4N_07010 [Gammaproteobacteria bacterium]